MKISLLLPSRERQSLLKNCLTSFVKSAHDINNVEFIIVADNDDTSFVDFQPDSSAERLFFVERSQFCQRDYNNFAASKATGELVWVMNDDCVCVTKDWDLLITNYVNEIYKRQKDRILYLAMNDGTHGDNTKHIAQKSCCFPILSRETVDALGVFMPSEIHMWGADIALFNIFANAKLNRIYQLPELEIQHHSMHSIKTPREKDSINHHITSISENCLLNHEQYSHYINSLNRGIIE